MGHEGIIKNQERERMPRYREFLKSILEPVESISGENIRRTAGTFSLRNLAGKLIEIDFATSTHESEPGSQQASELELNFLRRHLIKESTDIGTLLVEQGSPIVTQDHISTVIQEIAKQNTGMSEEINKRRAQKSERQKRRPSSSEIRILPEELAQFKIVSINIDLSCNPVSFGYILENEGLEQAAFYASRELSNYVADWKQATPTLVAEVFRMTTSASPKVIARIQEIAKTYLDSADEQSDLFQKPIIETNDYREAFMARKILTMAGGRYKLLCHTGHLVGIVKHLEDKLIGVALSDNEVATHKLQLLKKFQKT